MAEVESDEGLEWSVSTARMLNRTLPFDHRNAILFVREGKKTTEVTESDDDRPTITRVKLTGTEAKTFYEDVISMPQQSDKEGGATVERKRKRSKRRTKSQTHKHSKRSSPAPVSVGQVFCFVQEGNLIGVQSALSSGTCDVNVTDRFHWTLLMSAAYAGHRDIVEHLLASGAEWREHVDKRGRNAADLARMAGHLSIASFIETYSDTVAERKELRSNGMKDGDTVDLRTKSLYQKSTYYCDICKQKVTEDKGRHTTSTIHQFSCQHKPSVHHGYTIPHTNRGYQMMVRGGWDPEKGLGSCEEGRKYPVKTVLKQDRLGFGQSSEETTQGKARVTHFAAFDESAVKRRSERFERTPTLKKRDILMADRKDKEWEARMRRYMNSEHDYDRLRNSS